MLAPRWAHDPLSGDGAAKHGGRFNPPDVPALYMSEEFATAVAEYQQDLGYRPGTLCAYEVDAKEIVDLTDTGVCTRLDLLAADLRLPWKQIAFIRREVPATWRLAERLISAGINGVRTPSAQGAGVNVVLWRWDAKGSNVVALDPLHDLPRNPNSWEG